MVRSTRGGDAIVNYRMVVVVRICDGMGCDRCVVRC